MLPNGDNFVEEGSSRSWTVVGEDSNGWRPLLMILPHTMDDGPQQDHFISGREAKVVAVLEVEVVQILLLYHGPLQDHFISRGEAFVSPRPGFQSV